MAILRWPACMMAGDTHIMIAGFIFGDRGGFKSRSRARSCRPSYRFRFGGQQLRRCIMNKKLWKSKSNACKVKCLRSKSVSIIAHFFETVWAMGASLAATMVISTPFH